MHGTCTIFVVETYFLPTVSNEKLFHNMFPSPRKALPGHYLLPGPGNQAAWRFLILSYLYGFLILKSEQVTGTYGVAHRQVADIRRAWMCIYVCTRVYIHVYACICTYVCMCMHMYRLAAHNQKAAANQTAWHGDHQAQCPASHGWGPRRGKGKLWIQTTPWWPSAACGCMNHHGVRRG